MPRNSQYTFQPAPHSQAAVSSWHIRSGGPCVLIVTPTIKLNAAPTIVYECPPNDMCGVTGAEHGNQTRWFTAFEQGSGRLVHGYGTDRSAARPARTGTRCRRECHVRARRSHRVAHAPAWTNAHRYRRLWMGAALRRPG